MEQRNGIVLINKPEGFTSFDVVAVMRGVLGTKKVGHTGTLDPMATGVLPILCGRATGLCDKMPISDKRYTAVMRLGLTTDTLDITGEVTSRNDVFAKEGDIRALLPEFTGEIEQTPPMYSAVKVGGKKLCDIARSGKTVERPKRRVTVYSIKMTSADEKNNEYTLDIRCSKGTYIRSLCDDIGRRLGCGGVLVSLIRSEACGFSLDECTNLSTARNMTPDELIIPVERALMCYPGIKISSAQTVRFKNGGELDVQRTGLKNGYKGSVRVYSPDGIFLGLGKTDAEGLSLKCDLLVEL